MEDAEDVLDIPGEKSGNAHFISSSWRAGS